MEISSYADFVRTTRDALAAAGFVRQEAGGTVWWGAGEGPPLVLVHGVNDQAGSWFTIAPALARGRRVILPDLAGHGESEPRKGPIPVDALVAGLATAIDAAGRGAPVVLVGNSLGGWISTLYTLDNPSRVAQLVLETSGGLERPFAVSVVPRTREEALVVLRAVHGPRYVPQDWQAEGLLERAAASAMLRVTGVTGRYLDERLHELRCPVTLLWGEYDGVLPLDYGEELRAKIPGARLHVIPDAAHIPHLQNPAEVLRCLTAIC